MFEKINTLINFIKSKDGINDKTLLEDIVKTQFNLNKSRSVFYCNEFAIRFSISKNKKMGNTVLALSRLKLFDDRPFIVCIVSTNKNHLLLANSTFLKKISHSSQNLRIDNIRGSFNGSDILTTFEEIENTPQNFEKLFEIHNTISFEENLERLVGNTNQIVGKSNKFAINQQNIQNIITAPDRAKAFINSPYYSKLSNDLINRVESVKNEIFLASKISNVNLRGRVIEFLITENGSKLKKDIIYALHNKKPLPIFKTQDKLGDFSKDFGGFITETDIKSKIMFLSGNPKAYNIDKLLQFFAIDQSVYLIFLIGIDRDGKIVAKLCSVFDKRLLSATNIIHHWAGRNTRGATQFYGNALSEILDDNETNIFDDKLCQEFIAKIIKD